MLARAQEIDGIDWVEGSIEDWHPDYPVDLLFSNAALQWVGGHDTLFPRLARCVTRGGTLAIQMPRNHDGPSHTILAETAQSGRWATKMAGVRRERPVAAPEHYWRLLDEIMSHVDIWETIYLHALGGEDPVAAWIRSTGARPYLAAAGEDAEEFFADYTARLRSAYPRQPDGTTLFPFRRIFIVARR